MILDQVYTRTNMHTHMYRSEQLPSSTWTDGAQYINHKLPLSFSDCFFQLLVHDTTAPGLITSLCQAPRNSRPMPVKETLGDPELCALPHMHLTRMTQIVEHHAQKVSAIGGFLPE